MRRIHVPVMVFLALTAAHCPAQDVVSFGNAGGGYDAVTYSAHSCTTGACNTGGFGGNFEYGGAQLYPFDQQDPWLHGQYQRVPAYGGYSSFRPYNYRHIAPQSQIAANFGARGGMAYSQQFWNRYREAYLNQHLHSQTYEDAFPTQPQDIPSSHKPILYSADGGPQTQQFLRFPTPMSR